MTPKKATRRNKFFHFYQLDLESIQQFATEEFKYLHLQLEAKVYPTGKYIVACDECQGTGEYKGAKRHRTGLKPSANGDCCDGFGTGVCEDCHGQGYFYQENWSCLYLKDFETAMLNRLGSTIKDKIIDYNFVNGFFDTNLLLQIGLDDLEQLPEIIRCFEQTCLSFSNGDLRQTGIRLSLSQHCKA